MELFLLIKIRTAYVEGAPSTTIGGKLACSTFVGWCGIVLLRLWCSISLTHVAAVYLSLTYIGATNVATHARWGTGSHELRLMWLGHYITHWIRLLDWRVETKQRRKASQLNRALFTSDDNSELVIPSLAIDRKILGKLCSISNHLINNKLKCQFVRLIFIVTYFPFDAHRLEGLSHTPISLNGKRFYRNFQFQSKCRWKDTHSKLSTRFPRYMWTSMDVWWNSLLWRVCISNRAYFIRWLIDISIFHFRCVIWIMMSRMSGCVLSPRVNRTTRTFSLPRLHKHTVSIVE